MVINFEKTDGVNTFKDAIVLPDDVTLTDAEIAAIQQERFDNWVALINSVQE